MANFFGKDRTKTNKQETEIVGFNSTTDKTEVVIADDNKTRIIGFDTKDSTSSNLPVVGWLVIIEGKGKGNSKVLVPGVNKIGRDATNDVSLDYGDTSISRFNHIEIIYDMQNGHFFIERGNGRNLPAINGTVLRQDQDLAKNDYIAIGETTLMFIPLCDEDFNWQMINEAQD